MVATKARNIPRKDAKAAKEEMIPNLAFLASWREDITEFKEC
jgi:hypothetical protein